MIRMGFLVVLLELGYGWMGSVSLEDWEET